MGTIAAGGSEPPRDPGANERRVASRRSVVDSQLITVDLAFQNGALLLDLSETGMGVQALASAPAGTATPLNFELPETGGRIEGVGRIAWTDSSGRLGIRFEEIAEASRMHLAQWLARDRRPLVAPGPNMVIPTWPPPHTHDEIAALRRDLTTEKLTGDRALAFIVERMRSVTRATGAAIALEEGGEVVCRASSGNAPATGARVDPNFGLSGECLRTGEIVRCEDTETDPRADRLVCRRLELRSMVIVPVRVQGRPTGMLEVFSSRAHAFQSSDVLLLRRLSDLVAGLATRQPAAEPASVNPVLLETLAEEVPAEEVTPPMMEEILLLDDEVPVPPPPPAPVAAKPQPTAKEPAAPPAQPAIAAPVQRALIVEKPAPQPPPKAVEETPAVAPVPKPAPPVAAAPVPPVTGERPAAPPAVAAPVPPAPSEFPAPPPIAAPAPPAKIECPAPPVVAPIPPAPGERTAAPAVAAPVPPVPSERPAAPPAAATVPPVERRALPVTAPVPPTPVERSAAPAVAATIAPTPSEKPAVLPVAAPTPPARIERPVLPRVAPASPVRMERPAPPPVAAPVPPVRLEPPAPLETASVTESIGSSARPTPVFAPVERPAAPPAAVPEFKAPVERLVPSAPVAVPTTKPEIKAEPEKPAERVPAAGEKIIAPPAPKEISLPVSMPQETREMVALPPLADAPDFVRPRAMAAAAAASAAVRPRPPLPPLEEEQGDETPHAYLARGAALPESAAPRLSPWTMRVTGAGILIIVLLVGGWQVWRAMAPPRGTPMDAELRQARPAAQPAPPPSATLPAEQPPAVAAPELVAAPPQPPAAKPAAALPAAAAAKVATAPAVAKSAPSESAPEPITLPPPSVSRPDIDAPPAIAIAAPRPTGESAAISGLLDAPVAAPVLETKKVSHVTGGKLIRRTNPVYPSAAEGVHGEVTLKATVNREGKVTEVQIVKGPPVLAQAAAAAVKNWRYEPSLLDGVPIEVENTVVINFKPTLPVRKAPGQ